MCKKSFNKAVFLYLIMLFIILLTPNIAVNGAKNGLILWAYTVLPGIFPASFLASVIMAKINVNKKFLKIYIVICGLLTGFPGAAILYSDFRETNENDASLDGVLSYCNISSPSFVTGYIYTQLNGALSLSKTIIAVYLPAFIGIMTVVLWESRNKIKLKAAEKRRDFASTPKTHTIIKKAAMSDLHQCGSIGVIMEKTCLNMIKAGGFIVLFSCASQYMFTLMPDSFAYRGAVMGIAEITAGINQLCRDSDAYDLSYKTLLIPLTVIVLNNLGGLSTLIQTVSVAKMLNVKKYILNKLIYCALTVVTMLILVI